jgi:hypothetical protein
MIKIYRCNLPQHHDVFLEMVDIWEEMGFIETEYVEGHVHWADKEKTFLLWHWPRVDEPWKQVPPFRVGLFGNVVPDHPQCKPWTFFARSPRRLDKIAKSDLPSYDERSITSIFMGKVENQIQAAGRNNYDWSNGIEDFYMSQGSPGSYKYTKEQYLERLSQAKFGLTLPGYGPKCNRDIELMGVGTVPIVAPGCDVDRYHEPWIENVHYIRVERPEDIQDKVSSISKSQWQEMHYECKMWYDRNSSPEGSFNLTKTLIEKYK